MNREISELLAELRDPAAGGGPYETAWLTLLGRAVARGEAAPEVLHPRVASTPTALLRNEYVTRGVPAVPDAVLTEIVDEVFLPLVHGRSRAEGTSASGQAPNIS